MRLPSTLVLYAVPLIDEVRRRGYRGKLAAEPVRLGGTWVMKLVHEGEKPAQVPDRWHGHRVVVEAAPPPPPPAAGPEKK